MSVRSQLDVFANDIISEYRNGVSAAKIGRKYGVHTTTVTNLLKKLKLAPELKRGEHDYKNYADRRKAVALFNDGKRPSEIMVELNRSKSWFHELAKRENLNLRGSNGFTLTEESQHKIAQSKQYSAIMTASEKLVFNMLKESGLSPIPQYAVGSKNIDFVINEASLAVELTCRGTSSNYIISGYIGKRIKELGELGFHTYVLISDDSESVIKDGIDDLLAWIDFLKRQPAFRRQYRVVRSPAQLRSTGCSDSNNISSVATLKDLL